eukprot:43851_1
MASDPSYGSQDALLINSQIARKNAEDKAENRRTKKLLLIGTPSSGKSTLFKSLKIVNEGSLNESDLTNAIPVIRQNCVAGMLNLLKNSQFLYEKYEHKECLVEITDEIKSAIQITVNFGSEQFKQSLDNIALKQLGESIQLLWTLPPIRSTFDLRGTKYLIPDNMDYFFDKISDIMENSFGPTQDDVMRTRVRTTGIMHYDYNVEQNPFALYDIAGQRNERNKWIHLFSDAIAVLFVTALSHYHTVSYDDITQNAMHEAVEFFTEICNSKWFRRAEFILLLNKNDLFRQKLMDQIPLSVCFNDNVGWKGEQWQDHDYKPIVGDEVADKERFETCYQDAIKFITDVFVRCNQFSHRVVFCHVTCATDQDLMKKLWWDIQNIVIRQNLRAGGLV